MLVESQGNTLSRDGQISVENLRNTLSDTDKYQWHSREMQFHRSNRNTTWEGMQTFDLAKVRNEGLTLIILSR